MKYSSSYELIAWCKKSIFVTYLLPLLCMCFQRQRDQWWLKPSRSVTFSTVLPYFILLISLVSLLQFPRLSELNRKSQEWLETVKLGKLCSRSGFISPTSFCLYAYIIILRVFPRTEEQGGSWRPQVSCLITSTKTEEPGRPKEELNLHTIWDVSVCYEWVTEQGPISVLGPKANRYRASLSALFTFFSSCLSLQSCLYNILSPHWWIDLLQRFLWCIFLYFITEKNTVDPQRSLEMNLRVEDYLLEKNVSGGGVSRLCHHTMMCCHHQHQRMKEHLFLICSFSHFPPTLFLRLIDFIFVLKTAEDHYCQVHTYLLNRLL